MLVAAPLLSNAWNSVASVAHFEVRSLRSCTSCKFVIPQARADFANMVNTNKGLIFFAGVNSDLRAYIISGDERSSFHLDDKLATLRVARQLDFETR